MKFQKLLWIVAAGSLIAGCAKQSEQSPTSTAATSSAPTQQQIEAVENNANISPQQKAQAIEAMKRAQRQATSSGRSSNSAAP